jgi:hypothetical protein
MKDNSNKNKRTSLKNDIQQGNISKEYVKKKSVVWDEEVIDELEDNKKKNPKKKIDEPKTPYIYYVFFFNKGWEFRIR